MGFFSRSTQIAALFASLVLVGCGGGGGGGGSSSDSNNNNSSNTDTNTTQSVATYTVGGTVSGLRGGSVMLQLSSSDGTYNKTISADGAFTFPAIADGSSFIAIVNTHPTGQRCSLTYSGGVISGANNNSLVVTCSWTKQFGVASVITQATATATDSSGNVYVVGVTAGNLDGNTLSGTKDAFIRKYDATGVKVYTKLLGVAGAITQAAGVAVAPSGDIYVVGSTAGGLPGNTLTGLGDAFLAKYSAAGALIFTKQAGATGATTDAFGVATDASGNVYVSGSTDGALPTNTLTGNLDFFLAKYDSAGTAAYVTQAGTAAAGAVGGSVAVDALGNVYVAGTTGGGFGLNPQTGTADWFLAKFSATTGVLASVKQMGVATKYTSGLGVAVDASNNVYVVGSTKGGLDGNTLVGTTDLFMAKYDSAGTKLFTKQMGVAGVDTTAYFAATDASGNVYLTGNTYGGLDGNTLVGTFGLFLTKYDSAGNKSFTKLIAAGSNSQTVGWGVATDASSNVYVAGATNGSLNTNTRTGSNDAVLLKFDSTGAQW